MVSRVALVAAASLYALSCIWVLLFPLLSISTGEVKSRKMYVDEHAMLVNSVVMDSRYSCTSANAAPAIAPPDMATCGICEAIRMLYNDSYVDCTDDVKIVIDSRHKPRSYDVITIPIVFTRGENERIAYELALELIKVFYNANWLSKRIVLLLLNENCSSIYSPYYDRRRNDLCTYTASGSISSIKYSQMLSNIQQQGEVEGLRREAYVVDLTDTSYSTQRGDGVCASDKGLDSRSCGSTIGSLPFNAVKLLVTGVGGTLPNMDVLAAALVVTQQTTGNSRINRVIVEGREYFHRQRGARSADIYSNERNSRRKDNFVNYVEMSTAIPRLLRLSLQGVYSALHEMNISDVNCDEYMYRLVGLLEFMFTIARGGGSGVHSQLTARNIDAITVKAAFIAPNKGITNTAYSSNSESYNTNNVEPNSGSALYSACDLLEMVVKLTQISSNLHEDLHHSHHYYLLMENTHFVGLSEFAWPLLLILIALLVCYMRCYKATVDAVSCTHRLEIAWRAVSDLLFEIALNNAFIYVIFPAVERGTQHLSTSRDIYLIWKCFFFIQFLICLMKFIKNRKDYLLSSSMRLCGCEVANKNSADDTILLAMSCYQTVFLLYFALLLGCYGLLSYSLAMFAAVATFPILCGLLHTPMRQGRRERGVYFFFVMAVLYVSSPIGLMSIDTLMGDGRGGSVVISLLLDSIVLSSPTLPFVQSLFGAINCLAFRTLIVHFG